MKRKWIPVGLVGLALSVAIATAQNPSTSFPASLIDKNGSPIQGTSVALRLGNFKTATVSAPTDDNGKTVVNTGNIRPEGAIVDFYRCVNPDGTYTIIGVEHDEDRPCPGATFLGTVPIAPGTTTGIAFRDGLIDNNGNTVTSVTTTTPTGSYTYNGFFGSNEGGRTSHGYTATKVDENPAYTVTDLGLNGESITIIGVLPSDIGEPLETLMLDYQSTTTIVPLDFPKTSTVVIEETEIAENMQDAGSGSSAPSEAPAAPQTNPATPPEGRSGWAYPRGNGPSGFAHYQVAPLLFPASAMATFDWHGGFDSILPQGKAQQAASYSIIANGNSTGEAFALVVNDPSGRVKAIPIPTGTALEPTGRRLAKALPADSSSTKQPVNAYCLQFHKEPPSPGMLYRIGGTDKQRAYEPVRYVLAAIDYLKIRGQLHPDIEMPEYLDAIRQYAVWAKQEKWDQKQFTENWIERTRKNAQNLKVKWTKDMEKSLIQAAPNRWRDISQTLDVAAHAERASRLATVVAAGVPKKS